jgi:hypothetical protein
MQGQQAAKQTAMNGDRGGDGTSGQHTRLEEIPVREILILRTKAELGEAIEQAIAPLALPILTNRAIQAVLVAAYGHRDSTL